MSQRWRVVNWWDVVFDRGNQWDRFNRLAGVFLWFVKSLYSQICVTWTSVFPHLHVRFSKIFLSKAELFLACNTRWYATEWESSRLQTQWIPFSYEMKVPESCDFRRLEQLTKKPPPKFHLRSWDDGVKPAKPGPKKIQSEPRTRRGHSQQWSMTTRLGQSASLQEEEVHVGGRWEKTQRGGPLWKIQFSSDGRIDGHTCASTVRKRAEMSVLLWALSDLNSCAATRRKRETNEHSFHAPRTSVSLLDR